MLRAGIPVGGIAEIAFFTVKKGMKPGPIRVREVLRNVVRFLPFAPLGERQNPKLGREARIEGVGRILSKRFKVAEVHVVQSGGKRLVGKGFFS